MKILFHSLFIPPTVIASENGMAPSSSDNSLDRLSALPDEILQQILSLLPAQESFRTCVLAWSWNHIWMLTRRLRITSTDAPASVQGVRGFIGKLLDLRHRLRHRHVFTRIDECDFSFNHFSEEDLPLVNHWIWCAIECQVESLRLDIFRDDHEDPWFEVHDESLFSQNLKSLSLNGIAFSQSFADFSCCPALEDLEIDNCELTFVTKMKSPSLKHLSIKNCASSMHSRYRICVPCLVSLWLDNPSRNRTPLLESTPDLLEAYVKIGYNADFCDCVNRMECEHVMEDYHSSDSDIDDDVSYGIADDTRKCVLLGGLSEATDLKLLSDDTTYIFRRDLNWCPTFSKLKTLLLNDYWCEPADCRDLACILKHAPILEKLTILFSCEGPTYNVEMKVSLDETTRPAGVSQHLKMVEVKCEVANERFHNVLELLASLNIYHAHNHNIDPDHPANPHDSIAIDTQGSTVGWFRANGPYIPFVFPLAIGLQYNVDDATSSSSSDATSMQQVHEIQEQEENRMATYFSQLCKVILPMISAHLQAPVDDLPRQRGLKRVREDDDFEHVSVQKFSLRMGQNGANGRLNEETEIEPNPLAIVPYKTTLDAILLSIYADP
ncbi:hypothetical protein ACP4OV_015111 [Aristida adscensionis]